MYWEGRSHERCVELGIMTCELGREESYNMLEEGRVMSGVLGEGGVMTDVCRRRES